MRSISDKKESKHGIFFTPHTVAQFMASMLYKSVQKNEKNSFVIFDPSCGTGHLLAAAKHFSPKATLFGVELDQEFAKEAQQEFPEVVQGDFLAYNNTQEINLIISNPPYFNVRNLTQDQRNQYKQQYVSYDGNGDILNLFIEKSIKMLKDGGSAIFIVQRYFLETEHAGLRTFLKDYTILDIIDFKKNRLFKEVDCNAETCIMHIVKKVPTAKHKINIHDGDKYAQELLQGKQPKQSSYKLAQNTLSEERWIFSEIDEVAAISSDILLGDICEIGVGYLTSADKAYEINAQQRQEIEPEVLREVIKNKDIGQEEIKAPESFWICPYQKDLKQFPKAYKHLSQHKEKLQSRPFSFKNKQWYDYKGYQNPHITEAKEKIIFRSFGQQPNFNLCKRKNAIYSNNVNGLVIKPEYKDRIKLDTLKEYLNSPQVFSFMKGKLLKQKASGFDFKPNALRKLPILPELLD